MGTTQQTKYFQVIEYILFFGLCGLAGYFMHGVLDKFFSGKTSISQFEVPIEELPIITICFSKPNSTITKYEYGSDFTIEYQLDESSSNHYVDRTYLKEGQNSTLTFFGETVYLEKIITFKHSQYEHCFKITSVLTNKYMHKRDTSIFINFNDTISEENLPTSSEILVSSKENSYEIVHGGPLKIRKNPL